MHEARVAAVPHPEAKQKFTFWGSVWLRVGNEYRGKLANFHYR